MALIVPSVYSNLVTEKVANKCKVASMAKVCGELSGEVGETVYFPKWGRIADATDKTKGTAFGSTSLAQTNNSATIKMVAPEGVMVYDQDNKTALGNAINEGASQQGVAIARKIDADLCTVAQTTPLYEAVAGGSAISETEMNSALALFGDEQDTEDFEGIVINSKLLASFLSMDAFTSTEKTYMTMDNGIVRHGLCGFFRGIPVFMADHGTYDSTKSECITYIIKKDALGIIPKEEIVVEEKREPEYRRSTVYSSKMYAVALLADDGVVVAKKTVPSA